MLHDGFYVPRVETSDVQRLLVNGYGRRTRAVYALLRIRDRQAAGAFLRACLPEVGGGGREDRRADRHLDRQLAIAFTHDGLIALGLDPESCKTFIPEFRQGMTSPHRARALGDFGDNAWRNWRWGRPDAPVHVLYAAFGPDDATLDWPARSAAIEAPGSGLELVDHVRAQLDTHEPFGFRDGLSQPFIVGLDSDREPGPEHNRVAAGEFLLGYKNEFGQLPASPSVDARSDPLGLLPPAPLLPESRRDLGRNGSFLVVRELEQHVKEFAPLLDRKPPGSEQGAPSYAELMIGRFRDGRPLVRDLPENPPAHALNDFTYYAEDRAGMRCPLGAHIRRAHPRDALASDVLGVSPERALQLANQHRILRRSRTFHRPGGSTGLFFLCFNTNLDRQFEFVQQTWLDNPKFAGLHAERDPLISNHLPGAAGSFTVDSGPQRETLLGLQAYVSVRGGAYFFLPGLRALKYLAQLPSMPAATGN